MLIELLHVGVVYPGTREEVHQFLADQNYQFIVTIGIQYPNNIYYLLTGNSIAAKDDLFIRKDLLNSKYSVDVTEMTAFMKQENIGLSYKDEL